MSAGQDPLEIVFSFDTTGSMYSYLDEVRSSIQGMIIRLQADIPHIRIAIFAHGDYCDRKVYITKYVDFTTDVAKLCDFVKTASATSGGDDDECYELVMFQARTKLSWSPIGQKALVLIGDSLPHEPSYKANKAKINWRTEAEKYMKEGIKIYAVQCGGIKEYSSFYETIADKTSGRHLQMSCFSTIFDMMMAVCYRERGAEFFDAYEKEVRARRITTGMNKDLEGLFGDLREPDDAMDAAKPKTTTTGTPKTKKTKAIVLRKLVKTGSKLSVARRKIVKAKITKRRISKLPIRTLRRENVPQTNFNLAHLIWTTWKCVVSRTAPDGARKRKGVDFWTLPIFQGNTRVPAVYEVAVQTQHHGKKYIVYQRVTKGFAGSQIWRRSDIDAQIKDVLDHGCDIFVRRTVLGNALMKSFGDIRSKLQRYDCAWGKYKNLHESHRDVVKSGVSISSSAF